MTINEILSKGFYRQGQTLLSGEWNKIPSDWKRYVLFSDSAQIEKIRARDDEAARKAFSSLYPLNLMSDPQIFEEIVTHREIYFVD